MASLREMKKRLYNIRTTGQLAGAMRTVATAKYSRINKIRAAGAPFNDACAEVLRFSEEKEITDDSQVCIVVIAGERGLCGGFNSTVLSEFRRLYEGVADRATVISVGKKATDYCISRGIKSEPFFPTQNPSESVARELSDKLYSLCTQGTVSKIVFVYQKFYNMLRQSPTAVSVTAKALTEVGENDSGDIIWLPDMKTASDALLSRCFSGAVYGMLLENAAGAQAATLTAMRSAYDNSVESATKLESLINRRRQSDITSGVIEMHTETKN